jgi:hypothetical protein
MGIEPLDALVIWRWFRAESLASHGRPRCPHGFSLNKFVNPASNEWTVRRQGMSLTWPQPSHSRVGPRRSTTCRRLGACPALSQPGLRRDRAGSSPAPQGLSQAPRTELFRPSSASLISTEPIGSASCGQPETRTFGELLIDLEETRRRGGSCSGWSRRWTGSASVAGVESHYDVL